MAKQYKIHKTVRGYAIYAEPKGASGFNRWEAKIYKTRIGATTKMNIVKKKFGKKGKYTSGFNFEVRKLN